MKSLICTLILLATTSTAFAKPIISCVTSGAGGAMVKSLVLEKNEGPGYTAKMESVFEDGVVEIQIPTSISTPVSTQYVLMQDHDLLMTLAVYENQAVVLYQSLEPSEKKVNVEFLKCN